MAVDHTRLKRFSPTHRLWHLGLLVVFMILSVTGIAWMYFETPWGQGLAEQFGGSLLQRFHGRVDIDHVVPDVGRGHRPRVVIGDRHQDWRAAVDFINHAEVPDSAPVFVRSGLIEADQRLAVVRNVNPRQEGLEQAHEGVAYFNIRVTQAIQVIQNIKVFIDLVP